MSHLTHDNDDIAFWGCSGQRVGLMNESGNTFRMHSIVDKEVKEIVTKA